MIFHLAMSQFLVSELSCQLHPFEYIGLDIYRTQIDYFEEVKFLAIYHLPYLDEFCFSLRALLLLEDTFSYLCSNRVYVVNEYCGIDRMLRVYLLDLLCIILFKISLLLQHLSFIP